jgi:hypothetical protein
VRRLLSNGLSTKERWDSFRRYAAKALSKPTYVAEERAPRLPIANELADVFRAARDGGPWHTLLQDCLSSARYAKADLTAPVHAASLGVWLFSEDEGLRAALARFGDPEAGEEERFAEFVRAAEAAGSGLDARARRAVLAFGSLFNFAAEPHRLPFIRPKLFADVEQLLGREESPGGSVQDAYRHHLEFARDVDADLRTASVPVEDMLDVQAVIFDASRHRPFWRGETAASDGAERRRRPPHYLSVCAIYRNEAPYLREWIEFHRLMGVERFYLYDTGSDDDHLRVLRPYADEGMAVLHDWSTRVDYRQSPFEYIAKGQLAAYDHCLREYGDRSRWVAFIDVDEFLFPPQGGTLTDVLPEYEHWPAVGVNWAIFGPSGHRLKPPGLVTESYLKRLDHPANRTIKSVVDPSRVAECSGIHTFRYDHLGTVDENHHPTHAGMTKSVSFSRLRINHYMTKSVEEYEQRSKARVRMRELQPDLPDWWEELQVRDEAILRYVPVLRRVMDAPVAGRAGAPAR